MRWSLHAILVTSTFGTSTAFLKDARAQDAKALFDEGWALMEQNKFDEACAKFDQSVKASGATAAIQSLAECEGKRGRNAAAYTQWALVASKLPEGADRSRALAKQNELRSKVALLTVTLLPDNPAGAKVVVGSVEVQPGAETAFDPGRLVVTADAPGRASARREIDAGAGVRQTIEVTLGAASSTGPALPPPETGPVTPPGTPPTEEPSHGLRTAGIIVGVVGVVSLGVGIGTWIPMIGANSDFDDGTISKAQAEEKVSDLAVVNGITLVTGIVGIAAGVTLIVVDAATTGKSESTVAFGLGPGSAFVRGTF